VDTQSCLLWSCLLVQSMLVIWSCLLVHSMLVIWSWDRPLSYRVGRLTPGPEIPIQRTAAEATKNSSRLEHGVSRPRVTQRFPTSNRPLSSLARDVDSVSLRY
jgi:hypothetical protein